MNRKILLIGFCLAFWHMGLSQNDQQLSYDLQECLQIAFENNLELKSTGLRAESSNVNYKQARNELLPSLGMFGNVGINNGRNINPVTNDFINEKLTFSNVGLSLNATVFNGFRIKNNMAQTKLAMEASEMEIQEAKQNLILDVTLRYIQILNAADLLKLTKSRLTTTEGQLERLESHYNEGVGNPADYTDMQGQYTLDEISVINATNALKEAKLNLFLLLGTEPNSQVTFENIDDQLQTEIYQLSANEVYQDALANLATFKAKELRIEAADKGIKVAKATYYPEVSIFGQLNSNYSSVSKSLTEIGSEINETGDFVKISSQSYPVFTSEAVYQSENIGFRDQLNNNLNSVIGVSVRIPIFNRFEAKNNVALQQIQLKESSIDLQNTKLLFKQSIEDAYMRMEAAFQRLGILEKQVEAYEQSFRINEIRFENGVSNIVEYLTSKNNLDSARLNLSNARFEYLLRVKILDYYRGM